MITKVEVSQKNGVGVKLICADSLMIVIVPLPIGGGVWGEGCAPSPANFSNFHVEIDCFGAF